MLPKKWIVGSWIVLILMLFLIACAAQPQPTSEPLKVEVTRIIEVKGTPQVVTEVKIVTPTPLPKGGDTLRFRIAEDPETLYNVQTISLTADGVMGNYLHARLIYLDAQGKAQPWLAQSWIVSDDQKEVTFKLQQGVKFHDGTDLNADAVKFHFDSIMDPANASPLKSYIGPLKTVTVVDPSTVKFVFDKPYAPFFVNMSYSYGGINSPTAVKKWGAQYGRHPVGAGPYMLKEWTPGSKIVLERFPDYKPLRKDTVNKGASLASQIILTVIPEEGTAQAALQTGEILSAGLTSDTIAAFVGNPAFTVVIDKEATNLLFLEFNHQKAPFNDVAFRKAIGYAINRDAVGRSAYGGYATSALSPLAVGIPGFDKDVAAKYGTPFDKKKAADLFAQAGWKANKDGILEKDGKPAKFVLKSYAGFATINRSLEVIQANLKDVGIEVKLETSDWGAFYPSLLKDDWDMDLMRWTWGDPGVLSDLFRSPGHRNKLAANTTIDQTLDQCNATMDPDKRAKCVSQAQQALLENMTIVPILTNWAMFAVRSEVQDYTLDYSSYLLPGDPWIKK